MFYIQPKDRRWNQPKSAVNKAAPTCKPSAVAKKVLNLHSSKTLNTSVRHNRIAT